MSEKLQSVCGRGSRNARYLTRNAKIILLSVLLEFPNN